MTIPIEKPELELGKEYTVELFPRTVRRRAKYLGKIDKKHIFNSKNGAERYLSLDEHWMVKDGGIITYNCFSSAPIQIIEADTKIQKLEEELKKLEEVGIK